MRLHKFACVVFALLVILTGCSGKAVEAKQADFSFNTPEGYSLSDVTDESCNIVSDEDGTVIGGITVTSLKPKLLTNEDSTAEIMTYLQNAFHKTNNVEFIAFYSGSGSPFVSINLTKDDSCVIMSLPNSGRGDSDGLTIPSGSNHNYNVYTIDI
mgnify:CR=1 FL=1